MKLLYCADCHDVRALSYRWRRCSCGKVRGRYLKDGLHAEYDGEILLGIDNLSLALAVNAEQRDVAEGNTDRFWGHRMEAFVIPRPAPTVSHIEGEAP
jgi:hypothetical protein